MRPHAARASPVPAAPGAAAAQGGLSPTALMRRANTGMQPHLAHAALRPPPGAAAADVAGRAALMRHMQRTQGNRAVQRLLAPPRAAEAVARPAAVAAAAPAREAAPHAVPVARQTSSPNAPTPTLQRDEAAGTPGWGLAAFGEKAALELVGQLAPQLVPVVRKGPAGVVDWLQDRAGSAAGAVFSSLMGPLRAITGVGTQLSAQYTPLVAGLQDAAAKIAANDCGPIQQAADKIEHTAHQVIAPIIEKLQPVIAKVQGFLSAAWDKIGAPIWEWIKDYAGQQWDQVKQLAGWIWSLSEPMRALGADAWAWIKKQIGIGDGPDGENGILQWLQGQMESAWGRIQKALQPFSRQMEAVKHALVQLGQTYMGPISQIASLASQAGKGLAWLRSHLGQGRALLEARSYVEKTLIPPLVDGLRRTGGAVAGMVDGVAATLGQVAAGLDAAASAVAHPLLHLVASAVQWLAGEAHALAGWAQQKLTGVAQWLGKAVNGFEAFLHGLAEFFAKVGGVVGNVWGLPALLAGKVWNWIPACIRDPVIDFIVPIVLRQIELFEELGRDVTAWQKTKTQVIGIVRRVFVDHDLMGAVKSAFALVLRVFNIPEEMLGKVAAKAAAAWDVVVKKPLEFIKNTVRSLGHGFRLLWTNIGTHLEHGIEGWLFGELADKNIRPPSSWTEPKPLFGFVVDVLGLNTGHIVELLKKRIDPVLVDKAQRWVGRFARAWDWITDVIDTSKSPKQNEDGLIAKAKDFGKSILTGAVQWVTGKVATELATLAAAAAASGGLSEVIDLARRIYKAMVTAKRWAGRILQMASDTLDHVLDIASGNVSKVGAEFEKLMDRGMPVVIGFLADQVGLGGVGAAIRDIVDKLREQVDAAVLWLIDKAKAGIEAVLGAISSGVAALSDWWKGKRPIPASDGTQHSLYFRGEGKNGDLIVESSPMPVFDFLNSVRALIAARQDSAALMTNRDEALKLAHAVDRDRTRLQSDDDPRHADQVAKLNKDMFALADALQPLIDVMYPRSVNASGLVEGAYIKILSTDQRAIVKAVGPDPALGTLETVTYYVFDPKALGWYRDKSPQGGAANSGKFLASSLGKDFELTELNSREAYMGANPNRSTVEGERLYLEVARKMQKQHKLEFANGVESLQNAVIIHGGRTYTIDECHLSHIVDAAAWWNSNGRLTKPRSEAVEAFMNDPSNYELEPAEPNLRRGGALSGPKTRYRLPVQ